MSRITSKFTTSYTQFLQIHQIQQESELLSLPTEIVIVILSHLTKSDVLSTSKSCRKLSKIINETPEILNKFTIDLTKETKNLEWFGSRNYTKFNIDYTGISRFIEICEISGKYVKNMQIKTGRLYLTDLRKILIFCPNLKDLYIEAVSIVDDKLKNNGNSEDLEDFEDYVEMKGDEDIMSDFEVKDQVDQECQRCQENENSQKNQGCHNGKGNQRINGSQVKNGSQEAQKYQIGHINHEGFSSQVIQHDQKYQKCQEIQVRLQKLSIHIFELNCVDFIRNFLNLQAISLKYLELKSPHEKIGLNIFEDFKNLHTICIDYSKFENTAEKYEFPNFPQVKSLKFTRFLPNVINYFRNIENLEIYRINNQKIDLKDCKKLQKLLVSGNFESNNLILPKCLKCLTFFNSMFKSSSIPINMIGNNIETLILDSVNDLKWVAGFVANGANSLKCLKLFNVRFFEQNEIILKELKENLKGVKYDSQSVLLGSKPVYSEPYCGYVLHQKRKTCAKEPKCSKMIRFI